LLFLSRLKRTGSEWELQERRERERERGTSPLSPKTLNPDLFLRDCSKRVCLKGAVQELPCDMFDADGGGNRDEMHLRSGEFRIM